MRAFRLRQGRAASLLLIACTSILSLFILYGNRAQRLYADLFTPKCEKIDIEHLNSTGFKCVRPVINSNATKADYLVCVHPVGDWVSQTLIDSKPIEAANFEMLAQALDAFPDALFVDIGGFVGTHSLFAASRGHQTVTAEPFERNFRLIRKSVEANCFKELITVVPNCVSDERGAHRFVLDPTCFACSYIDKILPQSNASTAASTGVSRDLQCLLLDDVAAIAAKVSEKKLAIMKVDVEGHNSQVFTTKTGSRLFELFEVSVIFMEWSLQAVRHSKAKVDELVSFFSVRNYTAFAYSVATVVPHMERLKAENAWDRWPGEVVWIKESSEKKLPWKLR